jgi:translation initiation factor IF-2
VVRCPGWAARRGTSATACTPGGRTAGPGTCAPTPPTSTLARHGDRGGVGWTPKGGGGRGPGAAAGMDPGAAAAGGDPRGGSRGDGRSLLRRDARAGWLEGNNARGK